MAWSSPGESVAERAPRVARRGRRRQYTAPRIALLSRARTVRASPGRRLSGATLPRREVERSSSTPAGERRRPRAGVTLETRSGITTVPPLAYGAAATWALRVAVTVRTGLGFLWTALAAPAGEADPSAPSAIAASIAVVAADQR